MHELTYALVYLSCWPCTHTQKQGSLNEQARGAHLPRYRPRSSNTHVYIEATRPGLVRAGVRGGRVARSLGACVGAGHAAWWAGHGSGVVFCRRRPRRSLEAPPHAERALYYLPAARGVRRRARPGFRRWPSRAGCRPRPAALAVAVDCEAAALEREWRRGRADRWHAFCVPKLTMGSRRLYRWARAPADSPTGRRWRATQLAQGLSGPSRGSWGEPCEVGAAALWRRRRLPLVPELTPVELRLIAQVVRGAQRQGSTAGASPTLAQVVRGLSAPGRCQVLSHHCIVCAAGPVVPLSPR